MCLPISLSGRVVPMISSHLVGRQRMTVTNAAESGAHKTEGRSRAKRLALAMREFRFCDSASGYGLERQVCISLLPSTGEPPRPAVGRDHQFNSKSVSGHPINLGKRTRMTGLENGWMLVGRRLHLGTGHWESGWFDDSNGSEARSRQICKPTFANGRSADWSADSNGRSGA
jgi:hypothetical protein